jgi:hypothetical protein
LVKKGKSSVLEQEPDLDPFGSEIICLSGSGSGSKYIGSGPKFGSGSKIIVEIIICPSAD